MQVVPVCYDSGECLTITSLFFTPPHNQTQWENGTIKYVAITRNNLSWSPDFFGELFFVNVAIVFEYRDANTMENNTVTTAKWNNL